MVALTAWRDTKRWGGGGPERLYELPMAASTTIHGGSLVALNASGFVVPFAPGTGLKALGRAEESKTSAAGQNPRIKVSAGVFKWANSGTNAVTAASRGAVVYGEDDQTVGSLATGFSVAGVMVDLDADGVWVNTGLDQK